MSNVHYPQFLRTCSRRQLIGERWTLLIIRSFCWGRSDFGDLLDHLDGVSPTLLTSRLTALIESNVVRRITLPRPVQCPALRTNDIGREISRQSGMIRWGGRFCFRPFPETPSSLTGCYSVSMPSQSAHLYPKGALSCRDAWKEIRGLYRCGGENGTTIQKGGADCKATLEAPFDAVLQIVSMSISLEEAVGSETRESQRLGSAYSQSCRNYSTWLNAGVGRPQRSNRKT